MCHRAFHCETLAPFLPLIRGIIKIYSYNHEKDITYLKLNEVNFIFKIKKVKII
jgi:hypothetical protein